MRRREARWLARKPLLLAGETAPVHMSITLGLFSLADAVARSRSLSLSSQAERNNGRVAMMGITGMMVHNALGVDALFPIVQ